MYSGSKSCDGDRAGAEDADVLILLPGGEAHLLAREVRGVDHGDRALGILAVVVRGLTLVCDQHRGPVGREGEHVGQRAGRRVADLHHGLRPRAEELHLPWVCLGVCLDGDGHEAVGSHRHRVRSAVERQAGDQHRTEDVLVDVQRVVIGVRREDAVGGSVVGGDLGLRLLGVDRGVRRSCAGDARQRELLAAAAPAGSIASPTRARRRVERMAATLRAVNAPQVNDV